MTDTVNPAAEGMVRSIHPEKVFDFLPGMTTANLAALYGLDETAYVAVCDRFAGQTRQAAEELLAEPPTAAAVDALALSPGSTVAVIGESTTDVADSWCQILGQLLQLRRPDADIKLVNAAVSGYPTTMCLRVLSGVLLRHRPDWVVLSVGGNDVLRYGAGAGKPLVSVAETAQNLAEMRRLVVTSGARPVWMTLTAFDVDRAALHPPLQAQQIWLREADAAAVSDAILAQARGGDTVVDLQDAFGRPPDPAMLQPDGIHPSAAGQRAIARAFVRQLHPGPGSGIRS
jgi:lysophospholipase L1-like esterase